MPGVDAAWRRLKVRLCFVRIQPATGVCDYLDGEPVPGGRVDDAARRLVCPAAQARMAAARLGVRAGVDDHPWSGGMGGGACLGCRRCGAAAGRADPVWRERPVPPGVEPAVLQAAAA